MADMLHDLSSDLERLALHGYAIVEDQSGDQQPGVRAPGAGAGRGPMKAGKHQGAPQ